MRRTRSAPYTPYVFSVCIPAMIGLRHITGAGSLDRILDEGVTRLSRPYQVEVIPGASGLLRVVGPLALNLAAAVALGDEIMADLDRAVHGIGW